MKILQYINGRTILVITIALISCYWSLRFDFKLHFDVVLFGLAIAFPLATSIQTAFKRREKALEYLSLFRAGMIAIHYSLQGEEKLVPAAKEDAKKILNKVTDQLFTQLRESNGDMKQFQEAFDDVMKFVQSNREFISGRIVVRIIRYLKEAVNGATFLLSLIEHRTMAGLRFYSLSFIHVYAVLQAPMMAYEFNNQLSDWAIYFAAAFSSLILITLFNFQRLIEFPFDQKGADDIDLDDFKLNL